jgi:hypothetical protein
LALFTKTGGFSRILHVDILVQSNYGIENESFS